MPFIGSFPSIAPAQVQTFGVDFGNFLAAGITLVGSPVGIISVSYGTDNSAQTRMLAGPIIATISTELGGSGVVDAALTFQIGTCLGGVNYTVEVYCSSSDGDVVEAWGTLRCIAPGSA